MTYIRQDLLRDGSLTLSVDAQLRDAAAGWMPALPTTTEMRHPDGAGIRVDVMRTSSGERRRENPALRLGKVNAWVDATYNAAYATTPSGHLECRVDLTRRIAHVAIREDASAHDVTSALTIVSALLLVRAGRTPIHAAGVVEPGSRNVWLLAGDSHSGKSTTTANLVHAGWSYLSDDYVVVSQGSDESVEVEGWPGDFHMDEGWERGESTGKRGTLAESELPPESRIDSGVLAGILFPSVDRNEATRIDAIEPVVALQRLIRQSPWLMGDSASAPTVLHLLRLAASTPAGELRLGMDSYRDGARVAALISGFADRAPAVPSTLQDGPAEE